MSAAAETATASAGRYPFTPFPRGWFRVAYSHELPAGGLKPLEVFGRALVAFRTAEGRACVADAHCPHLGAHLGVGGEVVGNAIRCPFHHWEYDGETGRCTKIPYAKRIPPQAKLAMWPVVERNGIVMVYHDLKGNPPDFEIPVVRQLADPAWSPLDVSNWTVRASWLDMNENCVDQAHFKYVHGTRTIPPTTASAEGAVHTAVSRFKMMAPGGEVDAELVTKDYGPGFQMVTIEGLVDSLMINTCTPIDERTTDVSFAYSVKTEGETRKEHLAQAIVEDLRNQFEHDRPIWENKAHWTRPVLCDGDGPFGVYRKWVRQFV